MVPENFGLLILEAFVDFDANGPGIGDLMGVYEGNPLRIADSSISSVNLSLDVSMDGKMPCSHPDNLSIEYVIVMEHALFGLGDRRTGCRYSKSMSLQDLNQP